MTNEEFIKAISFDGEEWKDVAGFEGIYMVSSFGRVLSLERYVESGNSIKTINKNILSGSITPNNYIQYKLWKGNKETHMYAHKLVALAFIPNINNYPCVEHIDANSMNNKVGNLRWCTHLMNNNNPITRERYNNTISKNPEMCKWTPKEVVRINIKNRNDIKYYKTVGSTKEDGFNPSQVSAVCLGNRRSHKGYDWMYLSDYKNLINKSKNSYIQKQDN